MSTRSLALAALTLGVGFAAGGCKNIEEGQASPGSVGAACEEGADCTQVQEPTCLKMPGGYCSAECLGGLFDCDDQSICEELGDQAYYCLDGCLTENGNSDCRDDYRCSARPEILNLSGEVGVCVPKCESDADCETGRRCDTGSGDCVPRGERSTGQGCSGNAQCNGGLCLQADSFRGGYCSSQCGNQNAGCEAGSHCATIEGAAVCLSSCDGDGDCRGDEGYKCRQIGTTTDSNGDVRPVNVCVPRCQNDSECDDGFSCNPQSGDCEEGAGDPNPAGAFCAGDGDCADGACLAGERYPNGLCAPTCDGGCPAGTACGATPDGQRCLTECSGDLECRPGYVCADGGCTARCQADAECPGEQRCSGTTGRCYEAASGASESELVDIGELAVSGALSDELTLEIDESVVGFAVLAQGSGDDLMLIGEMKDPSGRTIYDFQDPFGSEARFFPSADYITQFVPSSPRAAPQPGTYKFRLIKDGGRANIKVQALLKRADGAPEGGVLDVNFFFADAPLNASGAQSDQAFQRAVETMRTVYAQRGIQLGEVAYCDLTGDDARRYGVIDSVDGPRSELSQMFSLSGRAADLGCNGGRALNFFMVNEIVGGRAGYIILGIAGGIPGPPGVQGTTRSGVAVTMSGYTRNPTQLGQTMAHEGGHYLGLFHTTEAEGTAFDPLPETPECASNNDRNNDGIVGYTECGGGKGAENLMFWAAGDSAEQVSGDQGFVVSRNPAVQ